MKNMKGLLKDYELNSDMQYFEMVITSVVNGLKPKVNDNLQ
jgi:hypothetical protein